MQQVKTWLANHGRRSPWRNKWSWREGWWMSAVSSTLERSLQKPNVSSPDSLAIAWYMLQYIKCLFTLTVMCAGNLNKTKKDAFLCLVVLIGCVLLIPAEKPTAEPHTQPSRLSASSSSSDSSSSSSSSSSSDTSDSDSGWEAEDFHARDAWRSASC